MNEKRVLLIKKACPKCDELLNQIKTRGWSGLVDEVKDFDKSTTVPPFIKDVPCLLIGECSFIVGYEEIVEFLSKLDTE